jgi:hypothetical protein
MFAYHTFSITDTNQFIPSKFSQPDVRHQPVVKQLAVDWL